MLDTKPANHNHHHGQNRYAVIPTAEKLGVNDATSGRGVTIAFLDSGFYPHPDFADRVIAFHDVSGEERSLDRILSPTGHHWHGTQTVTVCAGDGRLSDGTYRGLASGANLALVKVSRNGSIGDREIVEGLRWVMANRERYNIRILNMSLGGDCDVRSADSEINTLIEELTTAGVVMIVAAGNSSEMHSLPPASAPSAITVGGYSDQNQFVPEKFDLYHSNHGTTIDEVVKPEIIAPAMFVAAPILPGTRDYESAESLSMLATTPDYAFGALLEENWEKAGLQRDVIALDRSTARERVETVLRERKIISTHYQHVDGTSFAAPIVASVAATMLEANPRLTPQAIKNILISTANRLGGHPAMRQGFGIINASAALRLARTEVHQLADDHFHPPRVEGRQIVFRFHHDDARTVHLSGEFNGWSSEEFELCHDGLWKISIPCQPAGKYRYKFLMDGSRWIEDPSHGIKEDDGFGGFNSVLVIEG